ncbi:MAG: MgtC/SapB family protein [Chloroflexi bacterium]|nr:MAG: MgtC/SapB family protein [Chloroflexota bacterium]
MLTSQADLFYRFAIAIVIGILIGLERENAAKDQGSTIFAGIRTFALLALAGCIGALLTDVLASPWPLVAVILAVGGVVVAAYFVLTRKGDFGSTSEVAALIALLLGALCYFEYLALAAALAVLTTVLLSLKPAMHNFARHVSRDDVYATLKFAVITAIVLPILPNRTFGPPPFDALNPYRIWLMVVFISGISFTGYVLMKLVNVRNGIGLTGFLGGLVSSTAVTLSFSQRSRGQPALAESFALAITIAWAMMFLRVLIAVAALNLALLASLWLPLVAAGAALLAYAAFLYVRHADNPAESVTLANPFELGPALAFGVLYAAILLISRAAQLYLGDTGLYLSSAIAGLADVNAITLSMAELSDHDTGIAISTAAYAVILAVLSNTLSKTILVFATGSPALRVALLPSVLLGLVVTAGVTLLVV